MHSLLVVVTPALVLTRLCGNISLIHRIVTSADLGDTNDAVMSQWPGRDTTSGWSVTYCCRVLSILALFLAESDITVANN